MRLKIVPSGWLYNNGRRLDSGPYLSGALEAKVKIQKLSAVKDRLQDLTEGGMAGLVNAGRIKRLWVKDTRYGVPFLSSTDMLQADLSNLWLISQRAVRENPQLLIRRNWVLISRAGTIGRMVYARPDMDGMACTEDVLRVIPDDDKVPAGYLYAYLSSKFGVPLVTSGTYGAIIQHLEPQHIADLPVPRVGREIEHQVHELVQQAAICRDTAAKYRKDAIQLVQQELKFNERTTQKLWTEVPGTLIQRRMDAFHHSIRIQTARSVLAEYPRSIRLGDLADEVFEPNRGARQKVEDPAYGVPFLSSSEVFRLDPVGEYYISRKTPHLERLIVSSRDVLLPRSGQLGGIIGRAVLPLPTYAGAAASEHLVRVRCKTERDAHYLWAILASEPGYYACLGTAFGSSIPSLDCGLLADLAVPIFNDRLMEAVRSAASENVRQLAKAIFSERRAVQLLEQAIEGG